MHLGKRIALGLLLLPIAEVVAFLLVAWAVGWLPALGLMLLTSLAGGLVLRRAGRGPIAQARATLRARPARPAGTPISDGMMLAIAGILLVLPGFITDLAGAGLLIGPIRRRLGVAIGRAIDRRRRPPSGPPLIDLSPDEWRAITKREPPRSTRR
ncbi:MAG TPA: FxsA family protein [Xanthobacteraceae bacterium]|nr:FxsA family protein [Xanthobacteraceae bacterium]